jgi:predicted nucleic acid-binding protein
MIAATALGSDARVATANAADFRRLRTAGGPAIV